MNDETRDLRATPGTNHAETGQGEGSQDGLTNAGEADSSVRVEAVLDRFAENARARLKPYSLRRYQAEFKAFAGMARLDGLTRRQLAGPNAKALILRHLERAPKPSWRFRVAALKSVWILGLGLPWPLDSRRDLPRLPRTRREESPPDAIVKAWAEAMAAERDTYNRLLWLLVSQTGWRPSHVASLKWRNLRLGADGKPLAVVADGMAENFKTASPIAARLAPDLAESLEAWRMALPDATPESPLLPWRSAKGRVEVRKPMPRESLCDQWARLAKRHGLPKLRPKDLRHWVATACRKSGLSKQASAYLMGHDPAQGGAMRDWYDSPQLADVFDEQAACLPRGPLGLVLPPPFRVVEGLPNEAASLTADFMAGKLGVMDFATRMEALRSHRVVKEA